MISVIVCSHTADEEKIHESNVCKTIDCDYEYIKINNRDNQYGLAAAYNEGVSQAKGKYLVFVHEDVFFMEVGWGAIVKKKFESDSYIGLIGVAGTQYLFAHDLRWHVAGHPFTRGRMIHELDDGNRFVLSVFSWIKKDSEVVAVDGLFFAIRKDLFEQIRFDDTTFNRFHFYDLDICMQIRKTHKCIVTWDLLVKHHSIGKNDPDWFEAQHRFQEKYKGELPVSCTEGVPEKINPDSALNYEIKDLGPPDTIK